MCECECDVRFWVEEAGFKRPHDEDVDFQLLHNGEETALSKAHLCDAACDCQGPRLHSNGLLAIGSRRGCYIYACAMIFPVRYHLHLSLLEDHCQESHAIRLRAPPSLLPHRNQTAHPLPQRHRSHATHHRPKPSLDALHRHRPSHPRPHPDGHRRPNDRQTLPH